MCHKNAYNNISKSWCHIVSVSGTVYVYWGNKRHIFRAMSQECIVTFIMYSYYICSITNQRSKLH